MLYAKGVWGFLDSPNRWAFSPSPEALLITSFIMSLSDLFSNPSKEIAHMMKKGYIVRMAVSFFLIGTAVMLGYDGVHRELYLEVLAGFIAFGAGAMLITYCEMKRMEGLA